MCMNIFFYCSFILYYCILFFYREGITESMFTHAHPQQQCLMIGYLKQDEILNSNTEPIFSINSFDDKTMKPRDVLSTSKNLETVEESNELENRKSANISLQAEVSENSFHPVLCGERQNCSQLSNPSVSSSPILSMPLLNIYRNDGMCPSSRIPLTLIQREVKGNVLSSNDSIIIIQGPVGGGMSGGAVITLDGKVYSL